MELQNHENACRTLRIHTWTWCLSFCFLKHRSFWKLQCRKDNTTVVVFCRRWKKSGIRCRDMVRKLFIVNLAVISHPLHHLDVVRDDVWEHPRRPPRRDTRRSRSGGLWEGGGRGKKCVSQTSASRVLGTTQWQSNALQFRYCTISILLESSV